jgi:hypothetical protein
MKTSNLFLLAVATTFVMGSALARGPGNAQGGSSAGVSAVGAGGSIGSAGQSRAGNPGVGTATQTQTRDQTQLHTELQDRAQLYTPGTGLTTPSAPAAK